MKVPRGKEVKFRARSGVIPGTENTQLILEEDLVLGLSSSFGPVVGGTANKGLAVLGGALRDAFDIGFSGQFKELGIRVWQSTEPIRVSFTAGLYMKTNALKDVFRPALAYMKLPLPNDAGADENVRGYGLVMPGPSILSAFGDDGEDEFADSENTNLFSLRVGPLWLPSVVVESVDPVWSREVDSNGYPIWITLKMELTSIFTATTNQIDRFGYRGSESQ